MCYVCRLETNNNQSEIYFSYLDGYGNESIQMAQDFVSRCHRLVKEENLLWVAFQSNTFADMCGVKDGFNTAFTSMMKSLEEEGFHLARLSSNMRNTKEISQVKVDNETRDWKMNNIMTKLTSSTVGKIPLMILVHKNDFDCETQLGQQAIQHALSSIDKNIENLVVFHDNTFVTTEIKKRLAQATSKDIIMYPAKDSEQSIKDLKRFLVKNKKPVKDEKILLLHEVFFVGCEASNIIYVTNDYNNSSARCSILRATQNLIMVNVFSGDYGNEFTFKGFNVETKFLRCQNQLQVYGYGYECKTCLNKNESLDEEDEEEDAKVSDVVVCKSCKYACHQGHTLKRIPIYPKPAFCECNSIVSCKIER